MPDWLKVYHHLPYPLRVLAASARGYYLRWWRYGPETERLIEEALERETWSPQQWRAWQEERLAYVLHRARHKVPYYREYWDRRQHGNHASFASIMEFRLEKAMPFERQLEISLPGQPRAGRQLSLMPFSGGWRRPTSG